MNKYTINWKSVIPKLWALFFIVATVGIATFIYQGEQRADGKKFRLGLDLAGGSYLVYKADVSKVQSNNINDSMAALRDVIERRINAFGVSEPNIQTETVNLPGSQKEYRLVVELPGVTDVSEANKTIGQTPLLEFKIENPTFDQAKYAAAIKKIQETQRLDSVNMEDLKDPYLTTELSGKYLKQATVQFNQGSQVGSQMIPGTPVVSIVFNKEGADLFAKMTKENLGKTIAIYLDGQIISTPTVQSEISNGEAVITGNFTFDQAKELVGRLNSGALPVPVTLVSTSTIGPSLGSGAIDSGVRAGVLGLIIIAFGMLIWYRFSGFLGVLSLISYAIIMLAVFKLVPITLTAAGIVGFIISLGIAVDGNILIFERIKEELRDGKTLKQAVHDGVARAWPSIRDANVTSLASSIILFWFGTTLIKGFAVTFGLGTLVAVLVTLVITKTYLVAFSDSNSRLARWMYWSGFSRLNSK